jgi:hypothetical protein
MDIFDIHIVLLALVSSYNQDQYIFQEPVLNNNLGLPKYGLLVIIYNFKIQFDNKWIIRWPDRDNDHQ